MTTKNCLELKESEIEMQICHYLLWSGFCFWKQPARGYFQGELKTDANGRKVMMGNFRKDHNPYARRGLPDIAIVYRGFHCGLEVKTKSGRQSDAQKEFQTYLNKKGEGYYFIVRSLDDAKVAVETFKYTVEGLYNRLK